MLTDKQLQERKNYIGASDAAAVLGLSRWSTPLEVWAIKTGQILPDDISEKLPIRLGNKLEQVVAELFEEDKKKKVITAQDTYYHPDYSFIAANIDRLVVGENAALECKSGTGWKIKEWIGEEIPQEYIIQCYHILAVTGFDRMYLTCVLDNQKLEHRIIERDTAIQSDIIKREVAFWNDFVVTKTMPTIITKNDGTVLNKLFDHPIKSSEIELNEETDRAIETLQALKADLKNLEGNIWKQENIIKAQLGNNVQGISRCYKVTWKEQTRESIDTKILKSEKPDIYDMYSKESRFRVLRISANKTKEKQ